MWCCLGEVKKKKISFRNKNTCIHTQERGKDILTQKHTTNSTQNSEVIVTFKEGWGKNIND